MACLPSLSQFLIQATSFFHKFIIVIMLCQGTGQLERLADIDPSDDSCNANLESTGHVPGFLKPEVRPHPSYFVYQMFLGRARTKIAQLSGSMWARRHWGGVAWQLRGRHEKCTF